MLPISSPFAHAWRAIRRSPGFAIAAVAILAPAIGSATAMFSIVDAVFVRGLPYADPDRIQAVYESSDNGNQRTPSFPTVRDWRAAIGTTNDAIESVAFVRGSGVSIAEPGGPQQRIVAYIEPEFFGLMGLRPLLGRAITSVDDRLDAPPVAVVSFEFFERVLGGDRTALGKTVLVDSVPVAIVGVMPRGFAYPNFGSGGGGWLPPSLWEPISVFQRTSNALSLRGLHVDSRTIIRVRPGVDSAHVARVMHTIEQRLADEYPVEQAHWTSIVLTRVSDELFDGLRATLLFIGAAISLLLLLGCANVANLLLIRVSSRDRELAVRAALGADVRQLVGLILAEAVVLSVVAGGVGLWLAQAALAFVRTYAAQRLPFATDFVIDGRAAAFVLVATVVVGMLIALPPALHGTHGRLAERLRGGASSSVAGAAGRRVRGALVSLQVALAIAVLVAAGLLGQSVRRLAAVDLGYDPRGLISITIAPPAHRYDAPADAAALYKRILDATRAVPGVELTAAAGGALLPTKVETEDQRGAATPPTAAYQPISTDFLAAMRVHVVAGRGFTDDDRRAPAGLLVTESLAKKLWPGASPIGQRITIHRSSQARADFGQPITLPVVGVVADYREFGRGQKPPDQVFLPYTLEVWPWMNFIVRSSRGAAVLPALTKAVQSAEPAIVFRGTPSVQQDGQSFSDPRFFVMALMSAFAAIALVLSAIGLYGVVSYGAAQRTRELGIRIAVGATRSRILALVIGDIAGFIAIGTVAGLAVAAMSAKLLSAMLFETTPTDVSTFIVVPVTLALVAALAAAIPAYRASGTDPLVVLRTE